MLCLFLLSGCAQQPTLQPPPSPLPSSPRISVPLSSQEKEAFQKLEDEIKALKLKNQPSRSERLKLKAPILVPQVPLAQAPPAVEPKKQQSKEQPVVQPVVAIIPPKIWEGWHIVTGVKEKKIVFRLDVAFIDNKHFSARATGAPDTATVDGVLDGQTIRFRKRHDAGIVWDYIGSWDSNPRRFAGTYPEGTFILYLRELTPYEREKKEDEIFHR
jgi:hypothetical protein